MTQKFFWLLLFLFKSSLLMYFPFVTFVTLISTGTRKILFLSFHIVNGKKDDLSLTLPSLHLLRLLHGIR